LEKAIIIIFLGLLLFGMIAIIPLVSVPIILSPSSAINSSSLDSNINSMNEIIDKILENKINKIKRKNLKYYFTKHMFFTII
jgi:hypothetical protein